MFMFSHTCPLPWEFTFPTLELGMICFPILFRTIGNHFPHFLGAILLMGRLMKIFSFRSHFHPNIYLKLFIKEVNLFCCWTQSNICISDPFVIGKYRIFVLQKSRHCVLQERSSILSNIPLNMAIGIHLKIDPKGLQQKQFSRDFPQLLELRLLRAQIDGCFQSVRFRGSCLQNIREVARKTNVMESLWIEAAQNWKNSYFPKLALCVSLLFGLRVSFIFIQGHWKIWISVREKLSRIEIAYTFFLQPTKLLRI